MTRGREEQVTARRTPTLRAQWLGQQLRELREAAGLTLKDVGSYIQRDASAVSRLETGFYPARVPEVLAYVNLCGVESPHRREALVKLSQDVWQKGWWDGYAEDVAGWVIDRVWLETRATQVHTFQVVVLPGLLQTRDYAEAVIRTADPEAPEEQIARWVELRMTRQQILTRNDDPAHLTAIVDEPLLRRPVGGPAVMRAQLSHLLKIAEQPHIEVRVLPYRVGAHASPDGPFEIFKLAEPYADVGYAQTPVGEICVEGARVERLAQAYDRLREVALGPRESAALISAAAEDME